MGDTNKSNRIIVFQWLIGYKFGDMAKYRLTDRFYATMEEVKQYEICSANNEIVCLACSRYEMDRKDYEDSFMKYPNDPEYSRQIHHSGGLSGHSYDR